MNILGKSVVLRAIEESDLPSLHKWGCDPALWRLLGGWHLPPSTKSTKSWYERLDTDPLNLRLAICTSEDASIVGLTNILDIDWKNKHAFHGMMLGDTATRGKGIGRDTVMAIMRYAFDELGLVRLDGSMIEYNESSLQLYCGKCGWKEEGRQRNWYFREGRFWDRIMVGVTTEDYKELLSFTQYWSK